MELRGVRTGVTAAHPPVQAGHALQLTPNTPPTLSRTLDIGSLKLPLRVAHLGDDHAGRSWHHRGGRDLTLQRHRGPSEAAADAAIDTACRVLRGLAPAYPAGQITDLPDNSSGWNRIS